MLTVLCLASYFKGQAFIVACKRQGCHVILLTKEKLSNEAWPWEAIDERFLMPDLSAQPDITHAVSYLARTRKVDLIIPLDDFDVETAAALREHMRLPGMGDTTARHFRDKLAMRYKAQENDINVPPFSPVLNYDVISEFMSQIPPPWILKPRSQAGAMGIKKILSDVELWNILEGLGDRQSYFLLEKFIPGNIFHVDSIVSEGAIVFSEAHQYRQPPLSVTLEGGIFMSRSLPRESELVGRLKEMNRSLLKSLGMVRGVTHTEFILGDEDGRLYFLETASRVAGANLAELIEFSTGVNLWEEWAKIEIAQVRGEAYSPPRMKEDYAGIIVCLAKQETPDLSSFTDQEVVWRLSKKHHAGLIVASSDHARVEELLDAYSSEFAKEYLAVAPPLEEAPD